jgi:methyltransferase (TIGR00027 family)
MTNPRIEHISDTARWVALYRAIESDRPDAHFRDPWARRLLGEGGEAIARSVPAFRSGLWAMTVRTCLFDELIERAVGTDGVDTIVNLAAGLDARPWRMKLPADLRWVDVDLPEILAHKTSVLAGDSPACAYEAAACDLRNAASRRALFERIGAGARRALILTEGLLIYLTPEDAGALAADLHAPPTFQTWVVDLASPQLLQFLLKRWGDTLEEGRASMHFAPAEGTSFFRPYGWREAEFRSTWDESQRLKREMRGAWLFRFLSRFSSAERQEAGRRMSGIVRLERI